PTIPILAGAVVSGSLAVLAKATTFPAFALLGAGLIAAKTITLWRKDGPFLKFIIFVAIACSIPLVVENIWVVYTDAIKAENPIASELVSSSLLLWLFGTWRQRASFVLWHDVILGRAILEVFGYGAIGALLIIGFVLTGRRSFVVGLAAVAAFLAPLLIF